MVITKEILSDFKEKFEKAKKRENEESTVSRSVLNELKENIKNKINSEENADDREVYEGILAFVYRDLLEEDLTSDLKEECLEFLKDNGKISPKTIIPYTSALNKWGFHRCGTDHSRIMESKEFFTKAEEAYKAFKATNEKPMTLTELLATPEDRVESDEGEKELEKTYTLTIFYMAQILGQLGELDLSAEYCHLTLKRQLESKEYEPVDWALNAVTLSQYFLTPKRFTEARHHLAAATYILSEYEEKMITPDMSEEAQAAARENFNYRYSDIARCWVKYGLALLSASKEHVLNDYDDDEDDNVKITKGLERLTTNTKSKKTDELLVFTPLLNVSVIENRVTDQYCLVLDDAKLVFIFVKEWLEKAKEYYKAEEEASEYAKIVFDQADLYKCMVFFEEIPSNQSKLQKKRADCLEDLLRILNPKFYLSECRICWFNCALAYGEILDIKLDALQQLKFNEVPSPHALNKINMLCDKGISHLFRLIESYKDKNGELLSNIEEDQLGVVLISYFHLGRFFYKIKTVDPKKRLSNLQNSLKYYSLFISECEKYPEASAGFRGEIGVCKEMVQLLPHKLQTVAKKIERD